MRICLPTGIFPPDIGGPASYVPRIARALVERGHAVEVITLSDAPHDDAPYPFVVQRIPRGMARLPRMARTIARIAQAARRAEVVFANGLFIEAVLARGLVRRPLVMKVVGDWAWERATLNRQTADSLEDLPDAAPETARRDGQVAARMGHAPGAARDRAEPLPGGHRVRVGGCARASGCDLQCSRSCPRSRYASPAIRRKHDR